MEQKTVAEQIIKKTKIGVFSPETVELSYEQMVAVDSFIDFLLNLDNAEFYARVYSRDTPGQTKSKDVQIKISIQNVIRDVLTNV